MPTIGKRVRDVMQALLTDATYGLNAKLTARASDYGITDATPYLINFNATGKHFWLGNLSAQQIIDTDDPVFPILTLYVNGATSQNLERPRLFAGSLTAGITIYLSEIRGNAPHDFETPCDLYEDAMTEVFNANGYPISAVFENEGIAYNGGMTIQRAAPQYGGENWIQAIRFTFSYGVFV